MKDLDEATEFDDLLLNVNSYARANLVADFSDLAARVAFDVSSPTIDRLIAKDRPECLSTRWINVWHPQRSKSFIEVLARRYDFLPRLLALMISEPKQPRQAYNDITEQSFLSHTSRHPSPRHSPVEAKLEDGFDDFSELASVSSDDSIARGNLYKIIDDIWHYSSIDFGRSYVCIGYNSLYSTKQAGGEAGGSRLPNTMRLWTWLVLCDDNTVISIHEDPFPFSDGRLDVYEQAMLYETRRNLVNIFRSLSQVQQDDLMHRKPLGVLPIRARLGNTAEETAHRSSDMPGLLFYYLFENWHNSYSLITRRESRYGLELKALRAQMFEKPKLCHIDRLDAIGTELDILKRHFESYNRLMDRLLEPQTISNASLQNYNIAVESSQTSIDTVRQVVTERQSAIGVSLSSAVRVRFERLKDLIDLYALAEVQDFIKQKDSLVNMVRVFPPCNSRANDDRLTLECHRTFSSLQSRSHSMSSA